jgi:hypothetical protein
MSRSSLAEYRNMRVNEQILELQQRQAGIEPAPRYPRGLAGRYLRWADRMLGLR